MKEKRVFIELGESSQDRKYSEIVTFWDVGIYKSKASCFISLKKIDLHPHQEHVVLLFNQYGNSVDLKLLIFRLGTVKSQCVGHAATASALHTYPEEIVRGDVFMSHDILDLSFGFLGDGNGDQHGEGINFLRIWFGSLPKIIESAGFLTSHKY
jgi:hypothetical protein